MVQELHLESQAVEWRIVLPGALPWLFSVIARNNRMLARDGEATAYTRGSSLQMASKRPGHALLRETSEYSEAGENRSSSCGWRIVVLPIFP